MKPLSVWLQVNTPQAQDPYGLTHGSNGVRVSYTSKHSEVYVNQKDWLNLKKK